MVIPGVDVGWSIRTESGNAVEHGAPVTSGCGPDLLDDAWRIVVDGAHQGAYAGAVAAIARRGALVLHRATGWAVCDPVCVPMDPETIFDLASLTKVVATLPSVLRLIDGRVVGLDDPVGSVLPEFGTTGWKGDVTIRRLLSHSAGLAAWLPLYLDHEGSEAYLAAIANAEPAARPGETMIYSDLGFILLGEVVRRAGGADIARFAATEVFAPLGLRDTTFTPPPSLRERIAATERGNETEIGMCGERATTFPRWRRGMIWGEVNDGNSFYGLAGVAGHAGLFGTATDLIHYGQLWLQGGVRNGHRILGEDLVAEATREQAPGRGLGWRLPAPAPGGDRADPGRALGPRSYGHTGFTGTSLWVDPVRELVVVLLTNRLHPTARSEIDTIRPAFHAAVAAACGEE